MRTSLFIERHDDGLAFYINGDLQFDTADEAIYHAYLVVPAVSLVQHRFPQTDLRVLICGGGDGLAARDVLRSSQVCQIDLVDYNPQVLDLAQTVFKPYNQGSLESDRVIVHTQEAFQFVSALPDSYYHLVICDFTYPTCAEDTKIYSQEWFQQIKRILYPGGVMSTNGVSPENRTAGFWCLYQTLLSADLMPKPLQIAVPSFQQNGYGNWGLLIASPQLITKEEIENLVFSEDLKVLNSRHLLKAFKFQDTIASDRHNVRINTLEYAQLFYYLLNPPQPAITAEFTNLVDFLEIQESGTRLLPSQNWLQLESTAKNWLQQAYSTSEFLEKTPDINQLLPVQHRYHSPKMTRQQLAYIKQLLSEIDFSQLLSSILERAQELPPQMARDLKEFAENLRNEKPLPKISKNAHKFLMMVSLTVLTASLVSPDAVFAKGYVGGYTSSGTSSSDDYYDPNTPMYLRKILGFSLGLGGIIWLINIWAEYWRDDE